MNNTPYNKKGFALLLAVIVSAVVLSIGLALLSVMLKQLNLTNSTLGSEEAFQVAVAGMECLQYLRNTQPDAFVNDGQTVAIDCFDLSGASMTDSNGTSEQQEFTYQFDWDTDGSGTRLRCVSFESYVFDASSGDMSVHVGFRGTLDCEDGNICTYAFVQGYNKACGNINGNSQAVTRELSAEF